MLFMTMLMMMALWMFFAFYLRVDFLIGEAVAVLVLGSSGNSLLQRSLMMIFRTMLMMMSLWMFFAFYLRVDYLLLIEEALVVLVLGSSCICIQGCECFWVSSLAPLGFTFSTIYLILFVYKMLSLFLKFEFFHKPTKISFLTIKYLAVYNGNVNNYM